MAFFLQRVRVDDGCWEWVGAKITSVEMTATC